MDIGSKLALKVPPVVVVIAFAIFMWLVAHWFPQMHISISYKWVVFLAFVALGGLFSVLGVISFRRAKTTVNPTTPNAASSLVTTGVYKYTRNPMYVGLWLVLFGGGLYLENVLSLLSSLLFIWYMNQFQIKPEERVLATIFGADFVSYKKKVRRWL